MEKLIAKDNTFLGANYNKDTDEVEFKLFSKNAEKVLLLIFDKPTNQEPVMVLDMQKEGNYFKTSIKNYILDCKNRPIYYGYRVFGDNWHYEESYQPGSNIGFNSKFDEKGNRFNPNKVAYDPYTKELSHLANDVNPGNSLFRSGAKFYLTDNAGFSLKSVYFKNEDKEITKIPPRPFINEIIGEVHMKDLTQNLNMKEKGTYLGAAKFAKQVSDLGITTIEFLPLNEFDPKQGGCNHWGYMPLGYFSLARKYGFDKSYGNLLNEFQTMIDEFHKNGIKVCLDMVYNHTGEGGLVEHNPDDANLLSYALIDNASYYKTYENGYYRSNSGCGNDFNLTTPEVLDLVVDSLAFWANQGVDAFRFDLAAALLECSKDCQEIYDSLNSCANIIKDKLKQRNIKVVEDFNQPQEGIVLIAEPWTCGGKNCYQIGNFPKFWLEWNDVFRDTVRKLTLRSDTVTPYQIRNIFEGTKSIFKGDIKSVNYIACHDGFTLYDLNTFKTKSTSTSGGSNYEISGDYNGNNQLKENAIRKQLMFLFLSYGVVMIQIGDIIMHTKNGNNNSYNKDDGTNYLNWQKATYRDGLEKRIMNYTINLAEFIKNNPDLKSKDFTEKLTYFYNDGVAASDDNLGYWNNPTDDFFGVLMDLDKKYYLVSNKSYNQMEIKLPENYSWQLLNDSSNFGHIDFEPKEKIERNYILNPNSSVIFMAQ